MVEMKEVKPKISDRFKGFFIAHPLALAWIVIIAIIMFNSCGKAKAETVTYSTLDDYFYNEIQYHDTTFDAYYEQYKAENEYFYTCEWSYSGTTYIQIFFTNYNGLTCSSFKSQQNAAYTMAYGGQIMYLYNIESVPSGARVYCISGAKNSNAYCASYAYTTSDAMSTSNYYGYAGRYCNYNFSRQYGSNGYYENPSAPTFKYIKGDFNFFYNYSNHIIENNFSTYVEDSRLVFYTTFSQNGSDLLTTDITQFVEEFPIQDTSHSSVELVNGEITLTVNSDGTDTTYVLTASNSSITDTKYRFITPYDVFDLYGDDVKITNVSFALSGSGQGIEPFSESYFIKCEYWLKHTHQEVEPNDNPYADDVDGSVLTNSEKQALQYLVDFDHGAGLTFSQYHGLDKPDFFEDDSIFVYLSDGGTLGELLEDLANIPILGTYADMIASFINNIDDTVELQAAIYDYLYDNAYSQTSSMIVFVYIESWTDWTAGTIDSNDLTYYYYITTYGRIRQLNQTLADIYVSTKQTENNVAAIFDEVDGFEDSFIDFYNMTIADNATARGWLSTINNSINSLEFPVFDDSDIISKLNEIKTAITGNNSSSEDEDDTIEEAIKYYSTHSIQEAAFEDKFSVWFTGKAHLWLQSKKEDGEPNDPTSNRYYILTGMWDAVCNAYDYLTDESQFWYAFNAYIESITGNYNTSDSNHTEDINEKHNYMTFFNNAFYDVNEYDGQLTIGE